MRQYFGFAMITLLLSCALLQGAHEIFNAVDENDIGKVIRLIAGAPNHVNAEGIFKRTPLHEAASKGRTAIVQVLIASKANVNAKSNHESTPPSPRCFKRPYRSRRFTAPTWR